MIIPADDLRRRIETLREEWKAKNLTWIISGFAPALLYRVAEPEKFKKLVDDNRVASAKIVGIEHETSLMWQIDVDTERRLAPPDLIAA